MWWPARRCQGGCFRELEPGEATGSDRCKRCQRRDSARRRRVARSAHRTALAIIARCKQRGGDR